MPGRLILEIGSTQIPVPIKGTVTQIRAVVKRYALSKAISVDGLTEAQVAEAVLRLLLKSIRDGSIEQQRKDELQLQNAALETKLVAENDLYDTPTP